jgi:hypothetical protein
MDIKNISAGVTILVGVVGAVWFAASLDSRLRQLERQVTALAVAGPAVTTGAASGGAGQDRSIVSTSPLLEACARLADRAAEAIKSGAFGDQNSLRALMQSMGCSLKP